MNASHTHITRLFVLKGLAKMQRSSHFYRGVPPKVLVTSGTTVIITMIESQIEWLYFKFKLSQKWKHFLRSHSERVVTQWALLWQTNYFRYGDVHPLAIWLFCAFSEINYLRRLQATLGDLRPQSKPIHKAHLSIVCTLVVKHGFSL